MHDNGCARAPTRFAVGKGTRHFSRHEKKKKRRVLSSLLRNPGIGRKLDTSLHGPSWTERFFLRFHTGSSRIQKNEKSQKSVSYFSYK